MIDLDFRDTEGLIASYLLPEDDGWSLIETGPTTCRPALLAGLAEAGVDPGEGRRVFVTHIHLDHAGGVGALLEALPHATFYAHRFGVSHLVDPTRLVASTRRTWGAAADRLWGEIVPVDPRRIRPLDGGERFPLRQGELTVLATPGHARHHLAFFDTRRRALFTGDGAGVRLASSPRIRPAVPPPDLDLEQLYASLEAMRRTDPALLLYSHFGPSPRGVQDLTTYREIVEEWRAVAYDAAVSAPDPVVIAARLREHEERRLSALGVSLTAADRASLVSGYDLAAQGFLRYFQTRGMLGPSGAPGAATSPTDRPP